MNLDQIRTLLDSQTITVIVGGILAEYIRRVGKKADAATGAAQLAADRSEPTGNGFAASMRSDMKALKNGVNRIETTQRAQSRDIGGLRGDLRATTERLDHQIRRLDRHLEQEER